MDSPVWYLFYCPRVRVRTQNYQWTSLQAILTHKHKSLGTCVDYLLANKLLLEIERPESSYQVLFRLMFGTAMPDTRSFEQFVVVSDMITERLKTRIVAMTERLRQEVI